MQNNESMKNLLDEQEKEYSKFAVGKMVSATIGSICKDEVVVLLNYRFDGVIPKKEFVENNVDEIYKKGDEISAIITRISEKDSVVEMSKKLADKKIHLNEIKDAYQNHKKLDVKVTKTIEKGVFVSYKSYEIFVPISQLDVKFVTDTSALLGKFFEIYMIELDFDKKKMVGSRKEVLKEELEDKKSKALNELELGMKRKGTVVKIMDYGAFVDIGNIQGLIHKNDLSWQRIKNVEDIVNIGDSVDVYITNIDIDKKTVGLSLKDVNCDPWNDIENYIKEGDLVEAKVVNIIEKGAFVQVRSGIDAYLPISQISEDRVLKITNVLNIDDIINVVVMSIDKINKKMMVSLKLANEEPEEDYFEFLDNDEKLGTIGDLFKDKFKNLKF